jgi:hypothetical protein
MSSLNSPPLSLELCAPTLSVGIGYGATGLAALAPWVFLPWRPALGLSIAAAALIYLGFRLACWVGPRTPLIRVSWTSEGRWLVQDEEGEVTECELHHSSRVFSRSAWLALVPITGRAHRLGARHRLWITRYHLLHAAQLRALVVRLRLDNALATPSRLEAQG